MMLYKTSNVIVCLSFGDTDSIDIVAGELLVDSVSPFLFLICLDDVQQTSLDLMKENSITLKRHKTNDFPLKL